MERYLGMDVHSKSCTVCVLNERGKQIRDVVRPMKMQAHEGAMRFPLRG